MANETYGIFKISLAEKQKRTRLYGEASSSVMSDDKAPLSPHVKRTYNEYINGNIKDVSSLIEALKQASTKDALNILSDSMHHV